MHPKRDARREEGNHKDMWAIYATILPNMEPLYFSTNGNDSFEKF